MRKPDSKLFFFFSLALPILLFNNFSAESAPMAATTTALGGVRPSGAQNSAEVENLARFAVDEHNKKENEVVEFVRVVKASEQVVAGTLHYLTVEAIDAGKKKLYEAKVWVKPWLNFKELQEFKRAGDADDSPSFTASDLGVKKDAHGPGLQALPTHGPVVQDAANHALKMIQQRSNSLVPYELQEIVHANAEVVEDFAKLDMLLKVKRGDKEVETLTYSAHLRLPNNLTKEEVKDIVEGTIMEMGLQECGDTMIGNWHSRGISGGEKKRLSIALEILTMPKMLFLDEPTSGLDSASAFFVVQALRNIARDGRTVISSIHQPSSEVFALFDDLFLLSGGETVYFGEAKMAVEFFAEAGFPCPTRRNPSDHFLRCINSDFDAIAATLKGSQRLRDKPISSDPLMDMATAQIKAALVEKYRRSKYAKKAQARIQEISKIEGLEEEMQSGSQARWLKQLTTLTKRSFVNMCRDAGYYWARIVIYILVSICVGTVFYDVGYGNTAILARVACGAFITGFMTFMSIGGFPSFIEEMKVFNKERLNGYYGVAAYTLSNFLSSFPFLVAIALITGTITFYLVKFRSEFMHYVFFCLNIFFSITVIESLMMVVASVVPNYLMGIITGAGIMGILMMTSGFFRLLPDLPKIFWRYPISYISFGSWALQGAYKNDFIGLEFDPLLPGDRKLTGNEIITKYFGVTVDRSKWWDLSAVVLILVCYRLLFFVILKVKEKASPLFQEFYAKRTLQHLDKRPSFRKLPAFPSKRHQPLHSLSSQEGLNSPLH